MTRQRHTARALGGILGVLLGCAVLTPATRHADTLVG